MDPPDDDGQTQDDDDSDYVGNVTFSRAMNRSKKRLKADTPTMAASGQIANNGHSKKERKLRDYGVEKFHLMIDKYKAEIKKLQVQRAVEKAKNADLKNNQLAKSKSKIKDKDEKLGDLTAASQSLRHQLQAKNEEIRKLKDTARLRELTLKEYQDATLQPLEELESNDFKATDDNCVASQLSRVFRASKSWASRNAISKWPELDIEAIQHGQDVLGDPCVPRIASTSALSAIDQGFIPPKVVVNALLNSLIVRLILEHPFSVISAVRTNGGSISLGDVTQIISRSVAGFSKSTAEYAEKFRCVAASSLLPPDFKLDNVSTSNELEASTEDFRAQVLQLAMNAVGFLLREDHSTTDQSRDDLRKFIWLAVSTSIQIHAQYPRVTFLFLSDLKRHRFSCDHEQLEAHPIMNLKHDGDSNDGRTAEEAGVAGRSPDLVVEPLVQRSGDNQGKAWDGERLVRRAVIWICSPKDHEMAAQKLIKAANDVPRHESSQKHSRIPVKSSQVSQQRSNPGDGRNINGARQDDDNTPARPHERSSRQQRVVRGEPGRQARKRQSNRSQEYPNKKALTETGPRSQNNQPACNEPTIKAEPTIKIEPGSDSKVGNLSGSLRSTVDSIGGTRRNDSRHPGEQNKSKHVHVQSGKARSSDIHE
ncbi:uncharacterized protein HMPREF1541_08189 [Cyphellophora europaea CBS 101466]|uniref:Uncharacterized protein n=1 Tax=Cyphellophora europaea (strain CBS 101466) TaxID=1220924 RepID=W2RN80_CYPE1|nr:uncharacterized protein HMPREF1541_08189 [Cyphellophora europaea CBS 101466]ETN37199.1 hypothetical protein HMPREF1541_08189 [Cyphellophora europaea CBS 101466]